MKRKGIIITGAVVLVLATGWMLRSCQKSGDLTVNTATVGEGTVDITVTATGYIQPVDKVDVGTQVSGVIEKIYVDFNSQVKKGQLLAELDKSTLNEKLVQANASQVSAQSALTFAKQNFDRVEQLYKVNAATQASYEDVVNQLAQAETTLSNAKANVHQAKVNLAYAEIYSPIDGVVLNRAVEQGQTVAASFNTPTLFTIANDLKKMQVEADVDEADIGQVKVGQPVLFTVDAYPDDNFEGTVSQIRLQPTVTSNVVTYTVIIEAPNPEEKLFPGMTASVTITTKSDQGLTVPAAALTFHPDQEAMKKLHFQPVDDQKEQKGKGVWVQTTEGINHHTVKTGASDGVQVIIKEGLKAGDKVVLSVSEVKKTETNGEAAANPLMPRRPGGSNSSRK